MLRWSMHIPPLVIRLCALAVPCIDPSGNTKPPDIDCTVVVAVTDVPASTAIPTLSAPDIPAPPVTTSDPVVSEVLAMFDSTSKTPMLVIRAASTLVTESIGVTSNTSAVGCDVSVKSPSATTCSAPVVNGWNIVVPKPDPPNEATVSPVCTAIGDAAVPRAPRPVNSELGVPVVPI